MPYIIQEPVEKKQKIKVKLPSLTGKIGFTVSLFKKEIFIGVIISTNTAQNFIIKPQPEAPMKGKLRVLDL